MLQSHVIDVSGTFAGAAVRTSGAFRFIAVDPRVSGLDRSEWPSLDAVQRAVAQMLVIGSLPASMGSTRRP